MNSSHIPDTCPGGTLNALRVWRIGFQLPFPHACPGRGRKGPAWQTLALEKPCRLTGGWQEAWGRNEKWSQSPACLLLELKTCLCGLSFLRCERGWDSCQLSGHAAMKKRENTSMLKAFSSSTRLQPWFGESDPVTAHCGWGTSATRDWRSSRS